MSCRYISITLQAAAAFLLLAPQASAGQPVRSPSRPATVSTLPNAPAVHSASLYGAVSVVLTMPRPAPADAVYVDIRGPDGQVRRFPVDGGRATIQVQEVVLRPGRSVTIQLSAGK